MPSFDFMGKMPVLLGGIILLAGVVLLVVGRLPFLGRLPGDIFIQKGGFSFYFPVVSFLLISLVLTIVLNLVLRLLSK